MNWFIPKRKGVKKFVREPPLMKTLTRMSHHLAICKEMSMERQLKKEETYDQFI